MKCYCAKQWWHFTEWAVWDYRTDNWVIEGNGSVWVSDKKAVRIWAKYLNDNLPYELPLSDKPLQNILSKAETQAR